MGTVAVKWVASQMILGVDSFGHPLGMGSWPEKEPEWAGVKPSDLLLLSAASCSAYDVILILTRQRQQFERLEVVCTGERMPEAPDAFTSIHLHFEIWGELVAEKVARAIQFSEEKYRSVINTLKLRVDTTSDLAIIGLPDRLDR